MGGSKDVFGNICLMSGCVLVFIMLLGHVLLTSHFSVLDLIFGNVYLRNSVRICVNVMRSIITSF